MAYSKKVASWVNYEVFGKDAQETGGEWVSRGKYDSRVSAGREATLLRGFGWKTKIKRVVYKAPNPSPRKSVSLKNFTGTVTRKPDGSVVVREKRKTAKRKR